MIRLIVVAAASIGLILFVAFVVSRLLGARTRGLSVRMQVFLALAVIVGAFALGLGVMVIDRIEARAVRIASQAARDEAASIAGMLSAQLESRHATMRALSERLEQERNRGADLRFELLDARGQLVFPNGKPSAYQSPGTVFVDAPVTVGGRNVGAVRVVKPTIVMRNLLEDFAPTVLVISLVLGAAAAISAAWIGAAIARPIETLSAFAERVSAGERTAAPVLAPFGREVTRLNRSIDSMRRQLEGRPFVETFAADLSHELKNPVAAIRASAEVLEDSALEEPEEARRFVARIRESAHRIERLLSDLLSLARIEARGVESFDPVDVNEIVREVAQTAALDSERVQLKLDGGAAVRGDRLWLSRAIINLIHNALEHSPPDSQVAVNVRRAGADVELVIENTGSVAEHVQSRLFRRFVTTRLDKGGSGLGLSIVRAVAEAHGGRAELLAAGPPLVRFRLVLPGPRRRAGDAPRRPNPRQSPATPAAPEQPVTRQQS